MDNTRQKIHIIKLQRYIILDFVGDKVDLQDPNVGWQKLQQEVENKSCALYIDNVLHIDYIKQILPRESIPCKELEKAPF